MELTPTQRKNLVPLVLFLANLIYLYLGGLIFESIEYEPKTKYTTTDDASLFLETLKETSLGKRMLPSDFDSKEVVKGLQTDSLKNLNDKFEKIQNERIIASRPHWSFSNSLFFATTVVTTIGYGNLAPISLSGRMFCIIYALIGIPLTLMLLAVVGNHIVHYLNNACAWLVNRIRAYHSNYEFESADTQINAPVWIALPIIFVFLAIMSSMYCALEGWDFGTALYFIFITFTTIGFGDIVPRSQALALIFQGIWINLMLLYIGLSIVSITINLCAQSLMAQLKKTGLHTKILQLFSTQGDSAEGINARTQQGETADRDQARKSNRRKGKKGERIAMSDLEPRSDGERSGLGREDEEHSTRLKINREADGKHYGTLQE